MDRSVVEQAILNYDDSNFVVRRCPKKGGLGVFAKRDLKAGTSVGDYSGDLDQVDKLNSPFCLEVAASGLAIDPMDSNNKFRYVSLCHFINEPSVEQRCNAAIFYDPVSQRMYIKLIRAVLAGDEVVSSYGVHYTRHYAVSEDCTKPHSYFMNLLMKNDTEDADVERAVNKSQSCVFCRSCDPLCGILIEYRGIKAHHVCVYWAVSLDQSDCTEEFMSHLKERIAAASKTKCCECGKFGAAVQCYQPKCPNVYHVHCAARGGAVFDYTETTAYCRIHGATIAAVAGHDSRMFTRLPFGRSDAVMFDNNAAMEEIVFNVGDRIEAATKYEPVGTWWAGQIVDVKRGGKKILYRISYDGYDDDLEWLPSVYIRPESKEIHSCTDIVDNIQVLVLTNEGFWREAVVLSCDRSLHKKTKGDCGCKFMVEIESDCPRWCGQQFIVTDCIKRMELVQSKYRKKVPKHVQKKSGGASRNNNNNNSSRNNNLHHHIIIDEEDDQGFVRGASGRHRSGVLTMGDIIETSKPKNKKRELKKAAKNAGDVGGGAAAAATSSSSGYNNNNTNNSNNNNNKSFLVPASQSSSSSSQSIFAVRTGHSIPQQATNSIFACLPELPKTQAQSSSSLGDPKPANFDNIIDICEASSESASDSDNDSNNSLSKSSASALQQHKLQKAVGVCTNSANNNNKKKKKKQTNSCSSSSNNNNNNNKHLDEEEPVLSWYQAADSVPDSTSKKRTTSSLYDENNTNNNNSTSNSHNNEAVAKDTATSNSSSIKRTRKQQPQQQQQLPQQEDVGSSKFLFSPRLSLKSGDHGIRFACGCGNEYSSEKQLQHHLCSQAMQGRHNCAPVLTTCCLCGSAFENWEETIDHIQSHSPAMNPALLKVIKEHVCGGYLDSLNVESIAQKVIPLVTNEGKFTKKDVEAAVMNVLKANDVDIVCCPFCRKFGNQEHVRQCTCVSSSVPHTNSNNAKPRGKHQASSSTSNNNNHDGDNDSISVMFAADKNLVLVVSDSDDSEKI